MHFAELTIHHAGKQNVDLQQLGLGQSCAFAAKGFCKTRACCRSGPSSIFVRGCAECHCLLCMSEPQKPRPPLAPRKFPPSPRVCRRLVDTQSLRSVQLQSASLCNARSMASGSSSMATAAGSGPPASGPGCATLTALVGERQRLRQARERRQLGPALQWSRQQEREQYIALSLDESPT